MSFNNKLFFAVLLLAVAEISSAGEVAMITTSVPALSQVGLLVLAVGAGIFGARIIRKLKKLQSQ